MLQSVCKGEKWEEQYMLMLTVRCATRYWPKVREGDRKRQRNAGVSTVRAARHCQLFPQKFTWRGSQQLHVVRFLPPSTSFSLLDLLCVVCHCIVDRPMGTLCRNISRNARTFAQNATPTIAIKRVWRPSVVQVGHGFHR